VVKHVLVPQMNDQLTYRKRNLCDCCLCRKDARVPWAITGKEQ